jgi:DNA-binding MarR family transcriptional regulator
MADIISDRDADDEEIVSLIELLFFAYRDFTSDPDAILSAWGFGRAHHRVVHFVGRKPGMTVAQLLGILGITKQSLGRVLRDLIEKDLVYQRPGASDRRQRLLFLTKEGESLRLKLMAPQAERVIRALREAGSEAEPGYRRVLYHLISPENRKGVSEWLRSRKSQARE